MRNRLLGLTLSVDNEPTGWTTIVLTSHTCGQTIVLGALRTNATLRPEAAAEIVGPTLFEDYFFSNLPTHGTNGLRPEEN